MLNNTISPFLEAASIGVTPLFDKVSISSFPFRDRYDPRGVPVLPDTVLISLRSKWRTLASISIKDRGYLSLVGYQGRFVKPLPNQSMAVTETLGRSGLLHNMFRSPPEGFEYVKVLKYYVADLLQPMRVNTSLPRGNSVLRGVTVLNGVPIGHKEVRLYSRVTGAHYATTVSDKNGKYAFYGVQPEQVHIATAIDNAKVYACVSEEVIADD